MFGGKDMFDSLMSDGEEGGDGSGRAPSSSVDEDQDLMASLKKQMGEKNLKDLASVPDILNVGPASSSATSNKASPKAEIKPSGSKLEDSRELENVEIRKPALSIEEAEDLQRRLDRMTDEQVERVFEKMRASLASAASAEIEREIEEKKRRGERKPLPRATPTDPEMRSKYKRELTAIEEELEKIYDNPLKVWQDIMLSPEKYMTDEEAKQIEDEELQ